MSKVLHMLKSSNVAGATRNFSSEFTFTLWVYRDFHAVSSRHLLAQIADAENHSLDISLQFAVIAMMQQ
jgi:hypothetical protein